MEEADSIACIIDSVWMCPGNCTLKYRLPASLSGCPYKINISGNSVILVTEHYSGSISVNESLINEVNNSLDLEAGDVLGIKKSFFSKVEVEKI